MRKKRDSSAVSLAVKGDIWFDRDGLNYLGSRRIRLLEGIERAGSIRRAAQEVGLSYKAAWDAVDAMNNMAAKPLLTRAPGGAHGGGSSLTDYGREVVRLYRLMESGYQRLLGQMQAQGGDFRKLSELIGTITMRTSARNQFRGTVKAIHKGAVNADIVLMLGEGVEIVANITRDAVEELQLIPGREAVALIKASFVMFSSDLNIRASTRNRLSGTVTKVIEGAVNCEVKVLLVGGGNRILTGIVTLKSVQELGLRAGAPCCVLINATHVIVAVND